MSAGIILLLVLSGVDRWIRTSITSDSSHGGIGSFLIVENRLQPLFWFLHQSIVLDGGAVLMLALVAIQTMRWMRARDHRAVAGAAIVLGGMNNVFDRWVYGGVWDYWVVRHPWGELWFNIADIMIIGGVIYLFTNLLRSTKINKSINY